jgi:hypothetical protein
MSFAEARKFLMDLKFFGDEILTSEKIDEHHILALAEKLGKEIKFRHVANWLKFEKREIDFTPQEFADICFNGLRYQDETLLIITFESYVANRVFLVDYVNYLKFADNYDTYIGMDIDFAQPMDFAFFLLKQRIVVFLHHEGVFTQLDFNEVIGN